MPEGGSALAFRQGSESSSATQGSPPPASKVSNDIDPAHQVEAVDPMDGILPDVKALLSQYWLADTPAEKPTVLKCRESVKMNAKNSDTGCDYDRLLKNMVSVLRGNYHKDQQFQPELTTSVVGELPRAKEIAAIFANPQLTRYNPELLTHVTMPSDVYSPEAKFHHSWLPATSHQQTLQYIAQARAIKHNHSLSPGVMALFLQNGPFVSWNRQNKTQEMRDAASLLPLISYSHMLCPRFNQRTV